MEIVNLGKTPINSDSPSGEDVRYAPEFEELQNEIDKLSSLSSGSVTDWDSVVRLASSILSEKSKNLLVASYLCVGLLKSKGLEGFGPGISMYRALLENFWDSLFPPKKRMKGRINALEWWLEKTMDALTSLPEGTTLAEEARTGLVEDLEAVDAFLAQNMDDAPLLHQLKRAAGAIPAAAEPRPAEEAQPEAAARPTPQPKPSPAPAPAAAKPAVEAPETPGDQDPQKIVRQGLDSLRQASILYRQNDPSNALAYRLARMAAWLGVERLPPAQDGKTRIPPPVEQIRNVLNNFYSQGNFKELLEYAESNVGQFLFWLDLNRYVAEALDQLGYNAAREAVVEETAQYLNRLRGIEKLAFSDGTPFADEVTQEWIKDITEDKHAGASDGFVSVKDADGNSEAAKIAETYAQAQTLLKEKKMFEALDLLQKDLNGAGSKRSRLLKRISLTKLLVKAKKPRLALPHFLEVLEDVDRHGIETWSPDLALEALIQVYLGLRTQKEEGHQERAVAVLDRIARLNPAAAMRLEDGGRGAR